MGRGDGALIMLEPDKVAAEGDAKGIVDVVEDNPNCIFVYGDPVDKGVEGEPDFQGAPCTEREVVVDISEAVDSVDVKSLLSRMDREIAVGVSNIRLPQHEFLPWVLVDEVPDGIAERRDSVEGSSPNGFRTDHGVDRVPSGTEVVDQTELVGAFSLRNGEDRHRIHPGEEIFTKGRGPASRHNLLIALVPEELARTFILMGGTGLVPGKGVVVRLFIRKEPETFAQAAEDGVDKRAVGMVKQKLFKTVNIDWGDDLKKVRKGGQRAQDIRVADRWG